MSQEAQSPTPHQQPPSPSGPTTSELLREPPPVRKDTARQHELQDPSSPTKPSKLFRTQSGLQMPLIDIGDSFLAVPVSLNGMSVLADPKEVEEAPVERVVQIADPKEVEEAPVERVVQIADPKEVEEAPVERVVQIADPKEFEEALSGVHRVVQIAGPKEVEEAQPTPNTTDKGKARKDPHTSSDKPPLDPKKCPLMRSIRKKGSKSDISSLLTAPPACRKLDIDPAKSDDKENAMCPLEYGIFVMDD